MEVIIFAPTIWNSIPLSVRSCESLTTFRKHLKTFYFQSAFPAAPSDPLPSASDSTSWFWRFINLLTYLLTIRSWMWPAGQTSVTTDLSNMFLMTVANIRERRLRSAQSRTYVVTRTHSTFGDRAFAAAGPGLWKSLPPHLRDADLPYSRFQRS